MNEPIIDPPESMTSIIERLGYTPSKKKNWYKKDETGKVFVLKATADQRGVMFQFYLDYSKGNGEWLSDTDGNWEINRNYLIEYGKLKKLLKGYRPLDTTIVSHILREGEYGKCKQCQRCFNGPGFFCSIKCAKMSYSKQMHDRAVKLKLDILKIDKPRECEICHKRETIRINENFVSFEVFYAKRMQYIPMPTSSQNESFEIHHVRRDPELIMVLCGKCHLDVEKHGKYPHLVPEKSRSGRIRNSKEQNFCLLKTDENRNYTPERDLTWYRFNLMRLWSGLIKELPYPFITPNVTYNESNFSNSLAEEKMRCVKCGYVFNGAYRTTCPKCRMFFR